MKETSMAEIQGRGVKELLDDLEAHEGQGYTEFDREDTLKFAEDNGLKLVIPDENELQLDIDTEEQYQQFNKVYGSLQIAFNDRATIVWDKPSKSGLPKRHIIVKLPWNLPVECRVALQAALGSDPIREINNVRRIMNQDIYPVALFEKQVTFTDKERENITHNTGANSYIGPQDHDSEGRFFNPK